MAAVLRSESSTSLIDLYETFLTVCEKCLSKQHDHEFNDYIILLLNGMVTTDDTRVNKLITIYGTGKESIRINITRDISADNFLVSGRSEEAFDIASSSLLVNSIRIRG